jgi:tRNA modification GTPase
VFDQAGSVIDEALIAWFSAPNSYTGEDVVEIHCHGGVVLAQRILERTFQLGARLASPGEFTQRAFLNGKIDLVKAESVIDLIEAKTEKATAIQTRHIEGDLSLSIQKLREDLLSLISHLEVHLDYPEEETLRASSNYIDQFQYFIVMIDKLLATFKTGRILQDGLVIVITGKPNVGKSSLLNALVKEHRVIVSDTPGTTRDAVEVWMKISEIPVRIVDTAGLHETVDVVERMGMSHTEQYLKKADLILFVLDQMAGLTSDDLAVMSKLPEEKTIAVLNKIDLPQGDPLNLPFRSVVRLSAKTERGMPELWGQLEKQVQMLTGNTDTAQPVLTNERQKNQLVSSKIHIYEAIKSLEEGLSEDFWLIGLRAALRDLSEILGQDVSSEVLSNIFSRFCVGK